MDIFRKPESQGPADDSFICCPSLIAFDVESNPENREVLSRSSLLLDLVGEGVMNSVTQEVKELYHILEHEFLPIHLALQVQLLLTKISKLGGRLATASSVPEVQLSQYVPSLEKLAALRLLQRVSQVYQTMTIDNLSKLIPFFDFPMVEKISVDAVKNNFLAMKVGAIFFGNKDIFRKAILHPGPPQDFALLTVHQVIKPQKQVKLVEDENMLLENFLRTLLQELVSAAVESGEAIMQYGQSIVDEDARPGQIPRLLGCGDIQSVCQ